MESYLNDLEREEIIKFNSNATMREAVRKVLLAGIYQNGTLRDGVNADPTKNFALSLAFQKDGMSYEQLGQDLKACAEGIRLLETGFNELSKFRPETKDDQTSKKNKGR